MVRAAALGDKEAKDYVEGKYAEAPQVSTGET
jgi:hypothetical protein